MKFSYIAAMAVLAEAYDFSPYQDTIADGDSSDGNEIEDELDPNDMVVDDYGFRRNWGWDLRGTTGDLVQLNSEMRYENGRPIDNQMLLYKLSKYSDTIANGDYSDDKDLHEAEDENDDIVDINGSGRYRFAMNEPLHYMMPATYIEPFHFGTVPRSDNEYDSARF